MSNRYYAILYCDKFKIARVEVSDRYTYNSLLYSLGGTPDSKATYITPHMDYKSILITLLNYIYPHIDNTNHDYVGRLYDFNMEFITVDDSNEANHLSIRDNLKYAIYCKSPHFHFKDSGPVIQRTFCLYDKNTDPRVYKNILAECVVEDRLSFEVVSIKSKTDNEVIL